MRSRQKSKGEPISKTAEQTVPSAVLGKPCGRGLPTFPSAPPPDAAPRAVRAHSSLLTAWPATG